MAVDGPRYEGGDHRKQYSTMIQELLLEYMTAFPDMVVELDSVSREGNEATFQRPPFIGGGPGRTADPGGRAGPFE